MPPPKNWSEIKARWVALLERRTGAGIEAWNERVRSSGHDTDEATLRSWLTAQGVAGYPRQLLVMERFGYPDFLTAGADELIEGQYRDRPGLRPVRDALLALVERLPEVSVEARKGYIALITPRRTFGVIQATTRARVDLGLRLDLSRESDRLLTAPNVGNDAITARVPLSSAADVDEGVFALLELAYRESL